MITIKLQDNDKKRQFSPKEMMEMEEKVMNHFFRNLPKMPAGIEIVFDADWRLKLKD